MRHFKLFISTLCIAVLVAPACWADSVSYGGTDTTNVSNWTTNSVAFDDTTHTGFSLNWENVVTNNASIDAVNNEFDLTWEANTNHTIGHMFIYNEIFDLAATISGLQTLTMTANFEASAHANWSPVLFVDGLYYRWNHSGNTWNGNGDLDFSLGQFDLSQLGNATNTATQIWGELVDTATGFADTRINGNNPNLQATSGTIQFGFLQWTASTGGDVPALDFSNSIDSFEVSFDFTQVPEPTSAGLLGVLSAGLIIRRKRN